MKLIKTPITPENSDVTALIILFGIWLKPLTRYSMQADVHLCQSKLLSESRTSLGTSFVKILLEKSLSASKGSSEAIKPIQERSSGITIPITEAMTAKRESTDKARQTGRLVFNTVAEPLCFGKYSLSKKHIRILRA